MIRSRETQRETQRIGETTGVSHEPKTISERCRALVISRYPMEFNWNLIFPPHYSSRVCRFAAYGHQSALVTYPTKSRTNTWTLRHTRAYFPFTRALYFTFVIIFIKPLFMYFRFCTSMFVFIYVNIIFFFVLYRFFSPRNHFYVFPHPLQHPYREKSHFSVCIFKHFSSVIFWSMSKCQVSTPVLTKI